MNRLEVPQNGRAGAIFGLHRDAPNQKTAQNCSQVAYKSSLILPWINIMLDS